MGPIEIEDVSGSYADSPRELNGQGEKGPINKRSLLSPAIKSKTEDEGQKWEHYGS
jgi:hypothetical protein